MSKPIPVANIALPTPADLEEILLGVFSAFLDGEIRTDHAPPDEAPNPDPTDRRMVGSVSIVGPWAGHLMVQAGLKCARAIAAAMFMTPGDDLKPAEIADAIGEIANMIGGSVKSMIGADSALSLPRVVLEASALINPEASEFVRIRARWSGLPLEVSLWEQNHAARHASTAKGR